MQDIIVFLLRKDPNINYNTIFQDFPPHLQEHINKYQNRDSKEDSICAYILLNFALNRFQPYSLKDINFSHSKPEIQGIFFNISHSHGMVACCISDSPIGIDIEKIKKIPRSILKKYIDQKSLETLLNDENSLDQESIRWWTVRESIGKYLGTGITEKLLSLPLVCDNDVFIGDGFYTSSRIYDEYALSVTTNKPCILSLCEVNISELVNFNNRNSRV